MKKMIFLLALILACSCSTKETILKGDLYFKLVGFSSPDGLTEKQVTEIEKYLDSVDHHSSNKNKEDKSTKYFRLLRDNNLLRSPSITIKTQDNTIQKVFLSKSEYEKVKPFTLELLRKKGKKLQLEINARELDSNLYFSEEITGLKEIDGVTPSNK